MKRNPIPVFLRIVLLVLIVFVALGLYNGLVIRRYTVEADAIQAPVCVALISDLHSCRYGEEQRDLLDALAAQRPDLVVLAGDIFDDALPDTNTEAFLRGLSGQYPCYYVTGNHEYWAGKAAYLEKMAILDKYQITRLAGELDTISLGGNTINICGVDDPDAYLIAPNREGQNIPAFKEQVAHVRELSRNGNYTILISHRPEFFELYANQGFDLVLCGHAHGGQWRIPLLLNGLYAPHQGLFPQYAGGVFRKGATTMVVSRGLARESTRIPRFYNRPELVVVALK